MTNAAVVLELETPVTELSFRKQVVFIRSYIDLRAWRLNTPNNYDYAWFPQIIKGAKEKL